jgi:hypothetical protein
MSDQQLAEIVPSLIFRLPNTPNNNKAKYRPVGILRILGGKNPEKMRLFHFSDAHCVTITSPTSPEPIFHQ